jgi:serine/threonine-protein kinase
MDIDARSDIYSLGATFYHMVTGRVPFDASNPSEVMRKHLKESLIPPDHINTSLSSGTSEVIEVMMAKRKQDRYDSAEELLMDLNAVSKGEPPLRARKKFDIGELGQLQEGHLIETRPKEKVYHEDTISKYRFIVILLISVIAVLLLLIMFLTASMK